MSDLEKISGLLNNKNIGGELTHKLREQISAEGCKILAVDTLEREKDNLNWISDYKVTSEKISISNEKYNEMKVMMETSLKNPPKDFSNKEYSFC